MLPGSTSTTNIRAVSVSHIPAFNRIEQADGGWICGKRIREPDFGSQLCWRATMRLNLFVVLLISPEVERYASARREPNTLLRRTTADFHRPMIRRLDQGGSSIEGVCPCFSSRRPSVMPVCFERQPVVEGTESGEAGFLCLRAAERNSHPFLLAYRPGCGVAARLT